ncbi:hypothetical protein B0H13DRAFT_2153144 [Mycena leptocephala]|nr:hypothetical protein B0H13DRAFT_2153144 [Mycena leptocephala]
MGKLRGYTSKGWGRGSNKPVIVKLEADVVLRTLSHSITLLGQSISAEGLSSATHQKLLCALTLPFLPFGAILYRRAFPPLILPRAAESICPRRLDVTTQDLDPAESVLAAEAVFQLACCTAIRANLKSLVDGLSPSVEVLFDEVDMVFETKRAGMVRARCCPGDV